MAVYSELTVPICSVRHLFMSLLFLSLFLQFHRKKNVKKSHEEKNKMKEKAALRCV